MTHTKETNVLNQNIFFDPIAVPVHGQLLCGEEGKIEQREDGLRKKTITRMLMKKKFTFVVLIRIKSTSFYIFYTLTYDRIPLSLLDTLCQI